MKTQKPSLGFERKAGRPVKKTWKFAQCEVEGERVRGASCSPVFRKATRSGARVETCGLGYYGFSVKLGLRVEEGLGTVPHAYCTRTTQ